MAALLLRSLFGTAVGIVLLSGFGCGGSSRSVDVPSGRQGPSSMVREVDSVGALGGVETCFDAVDDNDNGLFDEGCGVPQGDLHFMVAWSEPKADVDLVVVDPLGRAATPGSPTQGGLAHSGDCPGKEGRCQGHDYESVALEGDDAEPGRYELRVRLVSVPEPSRLDRAPVIVRAGVRLGAETRSYEIRLHEELEEVRLDVEYSHGAPEAGSESETDAAPEVDDENSEERGAGEAGAEADDEETGGAGAEMAP